MVFEKITLYLERNTMFSFCSCVIKKVDHKAGLYFLAGILTVLSLFFIKSIYSYSYVYHGSDLRMKSGYVLVEKGVKTQNAKKGIFTYGPYVKLAAGEYKITLNYELSKNAEASFDIVTDKGKKLLYKGNLLPSQKQINHKIKLDKSCEIEVRTFYSGKGDLMVKQLTIVPLSVFAKYDVLLLITLFTLFFLLYFKILAWLMKLKWVQNKSRIDIVFLTVFFILLFLPMLHISDAEKSEQENRMLAKYTPLIDYRGGYNLKYGKNFDAWFNDRFFGRNFLLDVFRNIKCFNRIYQNNGGIADKTNGIFIYKPQLDQSYWQASVEKLNKIHENLQKLADFCKGQGIFLYVLIAPQKATVYKDKISMFNLDNKQPFSLYLKEYIKENPIDNMEFMYPLDTLLSINEEKEDYLYYLSDTHMTDFGTFVLYNVLMDKVVQKFPKANRVELNDFNYTLSNKVISEANKGFQTGDMNRRTLNSEKYLKRLYRHYNMLSMFSNVKEINHKYDEKVIYHPEAFYKAVLIGSSYTSKMSSFFNFEETYLLRLNNYLSSHKIEELYDTFKKFDPDFIVMFINEGSISYLIDMY